MMVPRFVILFLVMLLVPQTALADTLRGRAVIREQIVLPVGLRFKAVVEEVSRADAPAELLGQTAYTTTGQPPFDFEIEYDPISLRPGAIYVLRASLHHEARLIFTTDTFTQVLVGGAGETVEVQMRRTPNDQEDIVTPGIGAHGLRLPASFEGVLPCTDCDGVRHHLDLWPDQVYHMTREWLGRDASSAIVRRDEIGRWFADPGKQTLILFGASEMPLQWEVVADDRLRQLDMQGNPILSSLNHELKSDGTLRQGELANLFLQGVMTIEDGDAIFRECLSGRAYPISQDGAYDELMAAYHAAEEDPGGPVLVHLEGGILARPGDMKDDGFHIHVARSRVIEAEAGGSCPGFARDISVATLSNTYWKVTIIGAEPVHVVPGTREPHIVLQDTPEPRFRATAGCNRLIGSYHLDGETLTFGSGASTRMACPPPLDMLEARLLAVLEATRGYRLEGQMLDLLDGNGASLATLAAVYLR